jgi:hypothetical protein
MKPPMFNTATKSITTRNAYGDYIESSTVVLTCHFRDITELQTQNNEAIISDAMAWFDANSGVVKGDILFIDDEYFKVSKVIQARRLNNPTVLFIKTFLNKYGRIS